MTNLQIVGHVTRILETRLEYRLSKLILIRMWCAMSVINNARMIPLYIAEMDGLKKTDPDVVKKTLKGNWLVNKNSQVPFCALGTDHALEHINRSMKVSGGLIGITLNANAHDKFIMVAPELWQESIERNRSSTIALLKLF